MKLECSLNMQMRNIKECHIMIDVTNKSINVLSKKHAVIKISYIAVILVLIGFTFFVTFAHAV